MGGHVSWDWGFNKKHSEDIMKTPVLALQAAASKQNEELLKPVMDVLARRPDAPPDASDAAVHLAAEAQAQQLRAQRGRNSTFLGGGLDASIPGGKTLLGG